MIDTKKEDNKNDALSLNVELLSTFRKKITIFHESILYFYKRIACSQIVQLWLDIYRSQHIPPPLSASLGQMVLRYSHRTYNKLPPEIVIINNNRINGTPIKMELYSH